jgi:hypothetical protein
MTKSIKTGCGTTSVADKGWFRVTALLRGREAGGITRCAASITRCGQVG